MTHKKIWFITGASRGMGVDFPEAGKPAGLSCVEPFGKMFLCLAG